MESKNDNLNLNYTKELINKIFYMNYTFNFHNNSKRWLPLFSA